MMVIKNNIVPLKGYSAMALWPFIFVRNDAHYNVITERHERIHFEQQKEMLVIGAAIALVLAVCGCGWWSLFALPLFFYWYGIERLIKWAYYRNRMTAYKNISFEREAYANQNNVAYLDERKPYAFLKYINSNIN